MCAHVMIKVVYPPDKAEAVSKLFIKSVGQKLPTGVRRLETYILVNESGIVGYTIYRIKNENYIEAFMELQKRMMTFREVIGLRYRIEQVMTAAEAMPLIGITPPEYKT